MYVLECHMLEGSNLSVVSVPQHYKVLVWNSVYMFFPQFHHSKNLFSYINLGSLSSLTTFNNNFYSLWILKHGPWTETEYYASHSLQQSNYWPSNTTYCQMETRDPHDWKCVSQACPTALTKASVLKISVS